MTAPTTTPAAESSQVAGPSVRPRKFRPEVQALRALAVLLVLVYHIDPAVLPGGYIGVDVFFVISGFLITGHLWREASTTGTVSLKKFWAARARRILPASLVTVVGVIVLAQLLLPRSLLETWWHQALASVLYVENWALARDAVDYQAASNAPTAFQHFWSLGVEEQFYLVWPLLVVLAVGLWGGARRATATRDPEVLRALLLVLFSLVGVASFAWGVKQSMDGDPVAYYSTFTRVWELAVGGILALVIRDTARLRSLRSTLAVFGVTTIVVAACVLDDGTPFPGVAALAPTLGACAVIAAGRTAGPGSLRRIVDTWAVQRLGDISYSLYLWHFPVIVFFGIHTGREPGVTDVLAIIATSFAMAIASYVLVEQPIRVSGWFRADGRMLVASLVAMALVVGLAATLPFRVSGTNDQWDRNASAISGEEEERVKEGLEEGFTPFVDGDTVIKPNPLKAGYDKSSTLGDCLGTASDGPVEPCEYGETENPTATVAVVGDSHAGVLAEPILTVAAERGWRVVTYLYGSCPFTNALRADGDAADIEGCYEANQNTRAALRELDPELVVTTYLERTRFEAGPAEDVAGAAGLAEVWNELVARGTRVVAFRDTPQARKDVVACVSDNYTDPEECGMPREEALGGRGVVPAAAKLAPRVEVVHLWDKFCDDVTCPAVIGNVLVYRDGNHVTRTYMDQVTDDVRRVLPERFDRSGGRS
ncbi:Peptidoglycan/LPS O-acetylase OafA/YrhL, contains acyltransferase and SGNH-hydrolase domains [Promicromonospora umidemergens]|uniref:Acyltransferase family protein n=1 Tax=Promicromonospora umidemergens TaxID=629679 RepID=A0ABP8YC47_9MICO|nr:acyltransferase family protein [Promicromonospora umidemergens]MCP2284664.1 Peptidoglycan/LPS O-acetylase OafA/YrhL, contains acyltransferase and SGNH-hydrolase domains [Promicromonospora umidemergens]